MFREMKQMNIQENCISLPLYASAQFPGIWPFLKLRKLLKFFSGRYFLSVVAPGPSVMQQKKCRPVWNENYPYRLRLVAFRKGYDSGKYNSRQFDLDENALGE